MLRRPVMVALLAGALGAPGIVSSGQDSALGPDAWTPPLTPWGDPDLQGIWSPGYTLTPLERPARFGTREYLTDAEVAELESAQRVSEGRDFRPDAGTVADVEGAYNDAFTGRGDRVIWTRRTSLVVDPPDGRIPPLTAEARARGVSDGRRGDVPVPTTAEGDPIPYFIDITSSENTDNPEDRPSDRCLGVTLPFVRLSTGTYSRIVQSPSSVTIYQEYGHHGGAYRTIHLDGWPRSSRQERDHANPTDGAGDGAVAALSAASSNSE